MRGRAIVTALSVCGVFACAIAHAGTPGCPEAGMVVGQTKISETVGGFTGDLGADDAFGIAVASIGDLDGDGVNDLAVGADQSDEGGTDRGAVYILFMNPNGSVKSHQMISSTAGGFTGPLENGDFFGFSVAAIGDLDGDGVTELAVGALGDDDGGTWRGAVYILFINTNGTVRTYQKISSTVGGFSGQLDDNDRFGSSVTPLGDLNNDGVEDLAVGAIFDDDGGQDTGAVYVIFLRANGTIVALQKISETTGGLIGQIGNGGRFGYGTCSPGDLDGDGVKDLAVGAYYADEGGPDRGAVYVLFMNTNGTVRAERKISSTQGGLIGPLDNADYFGAGLAAIGDIDRDNIEDIAVGAFSDDDGGADRGATYILFLNSNGSVKAERKISSTSGGFSGVLDDIDRFGVSAALLGDLNGDGTTEFAVGASLDDDGGFNHGAVWILSLDTCDTPPTITQDPTPAAVLLPTVGGLTGFSITAAGDPPLSYQWRRDGVALVNGGPISGANSPTLSLFATQASVGLYDCVVTNPFGSVTSASAVLGVRPGCAGDADSSGGVNFTDITTVLANFGNVCP